jgi:hypothetical protein
MAGKNVPASVMKSLVKVRIGDRLVDAGFEPACHTCTHPARAEIEQSIVQGHSYRGVASRYSEVEWTEPNGKTVQLPRVGWESIFTHFKNGHMPVGAEAMRQIVERRAEQIGAKQYEQQVTQIVDQVTFAQQVLTKTQERLISGDIAPEVRDGLAAAKFLQDMEDKSQTSLDAEAWSEAMQRYFEIAQRIMPPEMWEHFTRALSSDPILLAISQRVSEQDVVDAEIVDMTERD